MAPDAEGEHPAYTAYTVVRVSEEHWRAYRDTRLACLIDSPQWFGTSYAAAARLGDEEWRARATSPTLAFWLALDGERPVGTAGLWVDPDLESGMLIGMWVAPPARGSGVAAALVEAVAAEADRRGAAPLRLHVAAGNDRAVAFYRRLGFVPAGRIEAVVLGDGRVRDEIVMARVGAV